MIDSRTIPSNLNRMEYHQAVKCLKEKLRGDIEYHAFLEQWVCKVIEREDAVEYYDSGQKTGSLF